MCLGRFDGEEEEHPEGGAEDGSVEAEDELGEDVHEGWDRGECWIFVNCCADIDGAWERMTYDQRTATSWLGFHSRPQTSQVVAPNL